MVSSYEMIKHGFEYARRRRLGLLTPEDELLPDDYVDDYDGECFGAEKTECADSEEEKKQVRRRGEVASGVGVFAKSGE